MIFDCTRDVNGEQCGAEIEVQVSVSGKYRRATLTSPAEYPDTEVSVSPCCAFGHALTEAEVAEITADAEERFANDAPERSDDY